MVTTCSLAFASALRAFSACSRATCSDSIASASAARAFSASRAAFFALPHPQTANAVTTTRPGTGAGRPAGHLGAVAGVGEHQPRHPPDLQYLRRRQQAF